MRPNEAEQFGVEVAAATRLRINDHAQAIAQLKDVAPTDGEMELLAAIAYLREFGSDGDEMDHPTWRVRRLCDAAKCFGPDPSDTEILSNAATPALVRYLLAALGSPRLAQALEVEPDGEGRSTERAHRALGSAMGLAKETSGDTGTWRRMTAPLRLAARSAARDALANGLDANDAMLRAVIEAYRQQHRDDPGDYADDRRLRLAAESWLQGQLRGGHL